MTSTYNKMECCLGSSFGYCPCRPFWQCAKILAFSKHGRVQHPGTTPYVFNQRTFFTTFKIRYLIHSWKLRFSCPTV